MGQKHGFEYYLNCKSIPKEMIEGLIDKIPKLYEILTNEGTKIKGIEFWLEEL